MLEHTAFVVSPLEAWAKAECEVNVAAETSPSVV